MLASWRMRSSPPLRGDLPVVQGAERGVPVDPGHQGGPSLVLVPVCT
jgi:hypothetical protein